MLTTEKKKKIINFSKFFFIFERIFFLIILLLLIKNWFSSEKIPYEYNKVILEKVDLTNFDGQIQFFPNKKMSLKKFEKTIFEKIEENIKKTEKNELLLEKKKEDLLKLKEFFLTCDEKIEKHKKKKEEEKELFFKKEENKTFLTNWKHIFNRYLEILLKKHGIEEKDICWKTESCNIWNNPIYCIFISPFYSLFNYIGIKSNYYPFLLGFILSFILTLIFSNELIFFNFKDSPNMDEIFKPDLDDDLNSNNNRLINHLDEERKKMELFLNETRKFFLDLISYILIEFLILFLLTNIIADPFFFTHEQIRDYPVIVEKVDFGWKILWTILFNINISILKEIEEINKKKSFININNIKNILTKTIVYSFPFFILQIFSMPSFLQFQWGAMAGDNWGIFFFFCGRSLNTLVLKIANVLVGIIKKNNRSNK